jgi:hypothetical protein
MRLKENIIAQLMFIKTPCRLIFPTPHPQQILPPALAQKKTKKNTNSGIYDLDAKCKRELYFNKHAKYARHRYADVQDYGLNRCGAVQSDRQVPSFRKSLPPPFSE